MGLRGKRCGAGEHVRKGRMGGGARGGRGCGAGGRGGKRCGPQEHVRNGLMRGRQRYRCKACGLNFTDTPPRGMPPAAKGAAVPLYVTRPSMNRPAPLPRGGGGGLAATDAGRRGVRPAGKVAAVVLYVSGLSMNRTAKLLGVSTPTVMAWIERFAEVHAPKPEPEGRGRGRAAAG